MGLQLEDGKGRGYSAEINSENQLVTQAITHSVEHHANQAEELAYVLNFTATPTSADDCFLYMKNAEAYDMIIEGFTIKIVASEYIDIYLKDAGTPVGGSTIVPISANAGSGKTPAGTFQNGNDITGLSRGSKLYRYYHLSSAGSKEYNFNMDIVLPKNTVLTMIAETGTTAIAGFIEFYYEVVERG